MPRRARGGAWKIAEMEPWLRRRALSGSPHAVGDQAPARDGGHRGRRLAARSRRAGTRRHRFRSTPSQRRRACRPARGRHHASRATGPSRRIGRAQRRKRPSVLVSADGPRPAAHGGKGGDRCLSSRRNGGLGGSFSDNTAPSARPSRRDRWRIGGPRRSVCRNGGVREGVRRTCGPFPGVRSARALDSAVHTAPGAGAAPVRRQRLQPGGALAHYPGRSFPAPSLHSRSDRWGGSPGHPHCGGRAFLFT